MAILTADNFKYQARKPLDSRVVQKTIADMTAMAESIIYNGIIVYVEDEQKFYTFNVNNTVDPILKKWRELNTGGGNASIRRYAQDTDYKADEIILYDDKLYLVLADFKSDNTQTAIADSFDLDLGNTKFVPVDENTHCVEYKQNTKYNKDDLVYVNNELARVVADYTSDNTSSITVVESFNADITSGKLVLISNKNNRLKSNMKLATTIGNTTIVTPSDLSLVLIIEAKLNQLVWDKDGTVGYISSIDTTNSTFTVTTITKSADKSVRYYSGVELDDTILNQSTINFTDLAVVTGTTVNDVKVAQLVYDKKGTVAIIDSINTTNGEIKVTTITTKGKQFIPEFYRYNKQLNTDVDTTQLILFSDLNVPTTMTINDLELNQIIFDEDGTVSKIENIDTVNNEVTVRIITIDTIPTAIKIYKVTDTLDLIVDSQKLINIPVGITDAEIDQLVYDNEGTVAKIINIDYTLGKMMVQTITGIGMPTSPDHKEPRIRKGGSDYAVGDIIETTTTGTFVKVTQVDANGVLIEVVHEPTATAPSTVNGKDAEIDYEQVIYGGYGKYWYPLTDAAVLVAQTIAEGFSFEQGYEYEITNGGTGYNIDDVIASDITGKNVKVTQIGPSGEILAVAFTRSTTISTSGSGATIVSILSNDVFIIPDSRWNIGTALFTITNDDGASVQFLRTDNILTKYNAGKGTIYKFTFDNIDGVIVQEKTALSGSGVLYVSTLPTNATTMSKDILYVSEEGYCITNDNVNIHTSDFSNELKEYSTFSTGDKIKKNTTITKDKILYRATSDITVSNWNTDYKKLEEIKTDSAIIGGFIPNRYYAQNETIIEDNLVYSRITAGVSDTTLGADITNWKLVTKLHSSGQRRVRALISKNQSFTGSSWTDVNVSYYDGDQSMINGNYLVVPQNGIYAINLNQKMITVASKSEARFENDSGVIIAYSENNTTNSHVPSLSTVAYLTAGTKIKARNYFSTATAYTNQDKYFEMILLSDDQSDNLVAEAAVPYQSSWAATTTVLKFENSSNPSVINSNGTITLPEDGSYIFNLTSEISTANKAHGNDLYIMYKDIQEVHTKSYTNNISAITWSTITSIVTGKKGDVFEFQNLPSTAYTTSNLKKKAELRIFKIKSTNVSLTSKDLYADYVEEHKNDPSYMTYEEWVIRKYNQDNLTVTATINANQSLPMSTVKPLAITYKSGELDMIDTSSANIYKLKAPVSGYYSIESSPIRLNKSAQSAIIISKNTDANWSEPLAFAEVTSNNWASSVSKQVWLDANECVVIKMRIANVTDASILAPSEVGLNEITMTLLHTGSPEGDINRPDTWTPNTEVYLGNNLYGIRYTGSVAFTANQISKINQSNPTNNNTNNIQVTHTGFNGKNVVNYGGIWDRNTTHGTNYINMPFNSYYTNNECIIGCMFSYIPSTSVNLYFWNSKDGTTSYDVWCTYTK